MQRNEPAAAASPRGLTRATHALCWIGIAMLLLLPLPVLYEVIADQLGAPPIWVFEITGYGIIVLGFLAAGYGLCTGHHFRVNLLSPNFPRLATPLSILRSFAEIAFGVILLIAGGMQVTRAWHQDMRSDTLLAVPLFWPMLALPLGGLAILLQGIANLFTRHDREEGT